MVKNMKIIGLIIFFICPMESQDYLDIYLLPKLKTEEGYSADIVRTYIPLDICSHYVRTMSTLCPHNISLVRHISFVRCCADIYLQGYMSALYPSSVFSSG